MATASTQLVEMRTVYRNFPTAAKFRDDTERNHRFFKKKNAEEHPALKEIDGLLRLGESQRRLPISFLVRVYFACDCWLELYKGASRSVQEKFVYGLYKLCVHNLCVTFKITGTPSNLKAKLEEWWGEEVGVSVLPDKAAADKATPNVLLPDDQLMKRRLVFKGGMAYMWNWYEKDKSIEEYELEPANSLKAGAKAAIQPGFGGYVFRTDGKLFMARHAQSHQKRGKFAHSAYTKGQPVICAGEIAIVNGRIRVVNNSSGHYGPSSCHVLELMRYLRTQGVDMRNVLVGTFVPEGSFSYYEALEFIAKRGDVSKLAVSQRTKEIFKQIPGLASGVVKIVRGLGDPGYTEADFWAQF